MKKDYPYISREVLCRLFGKTRHAYYDHQWRHQDQTLKDDIILQLVHKIRNTSLPRLGTRKLLILLKPDLDAHQIQVGRESVAVYNEIRPHGSYEDLTPCQAHKKEGELKKTWKNYSKYQLQKQSFYTKEEAGKLPSQSKPASSF